MWLKFIKFMWLPRASDCHRKEEKVKREKIVSFSHKFFLPHAFCCCLVRAPHCHSFTLTWFFSFPFGTWEGNWAERKKSEIRKAWTKALFWRTPCWGEIWTEKIRFKFKGCYLVVIVYAFQIVWDKILILKEYFL